MVRSTGPIISGSATWNAISKSGSIRRALEKELTMVDRGVDAKPEGASIGRDITPISHRGLAGLRVGQRGADAAPGGATEGRRRRSDLLRRRVSAIGQKALRAAFELGGTDAPRFVFCSRHGEFDRTVSLLRSIAARSRCRPRISACPSHNALAGLLSIATKNPRGHTAIAAGHDSFGFGMLEGALCLAPTPTKRGAGRLFRCALARCLWRDRRRSRPRRWRWRCCWRRARAMRRCRHVVAALSRRDAVRHAARPRCGRPFWRFCAPPMTSCGIDGTPMNWRWARAG